MSPPSKKKKEISETIPNLETELKAIRTLVSKIEATQQSTDAIAEELGKRTKDLRMELATLRERDKSLQTYNSEYSKPTRPISWVKKKQIYIEPPEISNRWSILWFYI